MQVASPEVARVIWQLAGKAAVALPGPGTAVCLLVDAHRYRGWAHDTWVHAWVRVLGRVCGQTSYVGGSPLSV